MGADIDIEASGLLDGVEGQARRDRAELIVWLLERGFEIKHISGSIATPMVLPANRILGDDGQYVSARRLCESIGIELELLQRLQGIVGLPQLGDADAAVWSRADAKAVAHAKFFIDMGIDPEETVVLMRVLMEGLGHAAAMLREAALKVLLRPGASEIELAQAIEEFARRAAPRLGPVVADLLRLQIRHSLEIEAVNAAERATGSLPSARQVAVAFADLAGFTRLGEDMPPQHLQRLASRLVDLAHTVAVAPVRFIKAIGDAVMLVSTDPIALLGALLDLADAAAAEKMPLLRIGVASGAAVTRIGDWFGSPVNIASRVTSVANPGSIVATESTRDMVANAANFEWAPAGTHQLKGVREAVKLFRISRV